jgi:sterol desaturase/sphingolipid hydroxylase (fatty acid hydroxylase superfamily)
MHFSDFFINSSQISDLLKYNFFNEISFFIFGESRIGIKLLGIYFFISVFFYFFSNIPNKKTSLKNILRFVFPKKIYSHASSKMDFLVFFIRAIFNPAKLITFSMIPVVLSKTISQNLNSFFPHTWGKIEPGGVNLFLISVAGFLLFDLAQYVLHRFFHKTSILWPFHAPHHSAEVLNPFTVQREHFVWEIFDSLFFNVFMGIGQGILIWITLESVNPYQIFRFTLIFNVFNYIVGNFHHSHIWISFGFLDRIFVSPAIHHIHHSVDPKHRNKNYGYFLSIWDQMFGTIYVPKGHEILVYGIEKGVKNPHDNLWKFYFLPFKESGLILKKKFQSFLNIPILIKNKLSGEVLPPINKSKPNKNRNQKVFKQAYKLK